MDFFLAIFLKMFFIMTPFFVLSIFLTVTDGASLKEKRTLSVKVTISVIIICLILLFFGKHIFSIFGITLDAFRIGAGALLFLTAVDLIRGSKDGQKVDASNLNELAVVPLAIPIIIGPGAIGVLMVFGASFTSAKDFTLGSLGIVFAVIVVGVMLYFSNIIEKGLGAQGLSIISKVIGLFLAAISAQIIFTGIKNFLNL